jgi:hypothetical protein
MQQSLQHKLCHCQQPEAHEDLQEQHRHQEQHPVHLQWALVHGQVARRQLHKAPSAWDHGDDQEAGCSGGAVEAGMQAGQVLTGDPGPEA